MRFGNLEIHLVSDGLVWVDAGGPFGLVPRGLYQRHFAPDSDNRIPMGLLCMLIRSDGKTILVDTGLGDKLTDRESANWRLTRDSGGLVEGLDALGVSVADVEIVINTHLHSDHCGGNTRFEGEAVAATFPRARYVVQRMEWAEASHPDARTRGTYDLANFAPLVAQGKMQLLHGNTKLTDQVECVVTPGHTRGHQSVRLVSGDWQGLFVGDLATYAVQFAKAAWLTAYDVLPLENVDTKQRWQRWALQSAAWLFFEHDPYEPVGRLVEGEGRLSLERIPEAQPLIDSLPTPSRLPQ